MVLTINWTRHRFFSSGPSTGDIRTDVHLLTFNADYELSSSYKTNLTLGYYDEIGHSIFGSSFFSRNTERFSAHWSNQVVLDDSLKAVFGAEFSDLKFETNDNNNNLREVEYTNTALYTNAYWNPTENTLVDAGVRLDDHQEFGSEVAWNIGGAYAIEQTGTRLRARVAQSYRTPTLIDSESFVSNSAFGSRTQLANPDLETEDILGFELGVEQSIAAQHQLNLTYFYQKVENAVITNTIASFPNPTVTQRVNRDSDVRVSGFELSLDGSVHDQAVNYRLAYTAQAKDELIDVPDHIVTLDVSYTADKWAVGLRASYLTGASYGNPDNTSFVATDDRFVTRLYGHYQVSESLKLHARIENLFDEDYLQSDIFGTQIQGQSFGAFAGFSLTF